MSSYLRAVFATALVTGLFLAVGLSVLEFFGVRNLSWWLWLILPVLGLVVVLGQEAFWEFVGAAFHRWTPLRRLSESVEAATAGHEFSVLRVVFGVAVVLPIFAVVVVLWNALKVLITGRM